MSAGRLAPRPTSPTARRSSNAGRGARPLTGRPGLRAVEDQAVGREQLQALQRTRLLVAMADACTEVGASRVSVADVVERAGMSRRSFYECFPDGEGCLLAAIDHAMELARRRILQACDPAAPWVRRVRQAVTAALLFADREPAFGRLLVIGALAGGPAALKRRAAMLRELEQALEQGARPARCGDPHTQLAAEAALGAAIGILHSRLSASRAPRPRRLVDLAGELTGVIVLPYLGPAAARREAQRPAPAPAPQREPVGSAIAELKIRMTYRTMRTVIAVSEHSGASNAEIARAAGVADQGQISKLLARLEREKLVTNAGRGAAHRGEANSWRLTPAGQRLANALLAQRGGG